MPSIDRPLDELRTYRPPLTVEPDFEEFWATTLAAARAREVSPTLARVDYPIPEVRAYDVTFAGFRGAPIRAWYLLPTGAPDTGLPALVHYHGYSGSRGFIHEHLFWVLQGFAVLAVDTRGQGGDTGDPRGYDGGSMAGWMTQGLLDPNDYYYRAAYTDCVRALDFLATRDEIDFHRVAVTGGSQGGGLSLAVAGLDDRPAVLMADVPFLCHFARAIEISANGPYLELQRYLAKYPPHVETALRTLSYFDGMNLAPRVQARTLFSVAGWDDICPPSTVFAAYNHIPAPKEIRVYPYNGHEGGGGYHVTEKIRFVRQALGMDVIREA
jgi:cephalosporin-C deacetylase